MTSSLCTVPGIIVLSAAAFWLTENACASGDTTESLVGSENRSNPDPRIDALLHEVRSLRDEVQHLRGKTDQPWLTERRADEVTTTWGDGFIGDGGDITGWRTDSAGSDGQVVIRSQLQFVF